MNNAIHTLRIQNFKSIKDVELKPRRVNIIIGEPNVGKSNILEALSLLGGMFFGNGRFMEGQIRYENIRNLFYDNDWSREITVTGEGVGAARLRKSEEQVEAVFGNGERRARANEAFIAQVQVQEEERAEPNPDPHPWVNFRNKNHWHGKINKDGHSNKVEWSAPKPVIYIKKYTFQKQTPFNKTYAESYLRPPFGDNLLEIIETAPSAFRKVVGQFFTPFGFNLLLRPEDGKLEIQKTVDGVATAIPYYLIADTLQRIIFYLAAIASNDDSVIVLEEPEAHSHPEYVSLLARRIVASRNNQFFVATHSPYLITEVLEEMLTNDELIPELTIFAAYYEDYQTKVRQLSDEDIMNIRRDGLDVFYNMNRFVPEA
jgi:hypothetical protein